MRPSRLTGIAVLLGLASSCDALTETDTTSSTTFTGDPSVEIDPATFLKTCDATITEGSCEVPVVCAPLTGAMQSYVVTFTDLGPEGGGAGFPITLASSPPTPCSQRVAFTRGLSGHRYVADIDGYEQSAADLVPACSVKPAYSVCADTSSVAPTGNGTCTFDTDCFANGCYGRCVDVAKQLLDTTLGLCVTDGVNPEAIKVCDYQTAVGDRHMVQPGAWTPVTPRWNTPSARSCGFTNLVPVGVFERISIAPCDPLEDHGGGAKTGVVVRPRLTLGDLECVHKEEVPNPDLADAGAGGAATGTGGAGGAPPKPPDTILVDVGTVTKLDVIPADPSIPAQKGLACLTAGDVVFDQGIAPWSEQYFTVFAYDADHLSPTYSATCVASAVEGVITAAKCVSLTPIAP